ncbi:hypothetical protein O3M35_000401 [Rhynocoris fuscipes]|uniref:Exonuclease 1 n=1 Tax=Rhynocoris fuscipes TaxID=488301 RepID=A0AAW1DSI7_9HEMI
MGISGLLPFLEKASKPVNIKEYSGCTVAVDTYCWLHKGAFSCAEKLARGEPTDQYVFYCMKFVNMLLSYNIKPILVFDGRHLPAKAETEKTRKERRDINRKKAAELLRADRVDEARSLIRRCVDVTHDMATALMNKCHSVGVDCIVAPYEADAQLAFFNIIGVAHLIITEDSDLLLFGCKKVLFKMDTSGNGLLVDQELIPLAMKQPADQFSLEKFRYMCILSGCDYLPSLPGIGLAKALKFIKRTADPDICRALNRLGSYLNMSNLVVTQEYKDKFIIAESMFKYQPIYDPFNRKLSTLNPLPPGESAPIDERLPSDTWYQIALGNVNPFTLAQTNNWNPDDPKDIRSAGWNVGSKKNSIWSKDYVAPKQNAPKKIVATFDRYVTKIEKPKTKIERKNIIEEAISPKKNNFEEELNVLRNAYAITASKKQSDLSANADNSFNVEDDVDFDELFSEDDMSQTLDSSFSIRHSKNPFSKKSTMVDKPTQLTPLCGALAKMSKISTPINENNGEVSRYFGSNTSNKEENSIKEIVPEPIVKSVEDNILKDILNTPEKLLSNEVIPTESVTPTTSRRNIFSSSLTKSTKSMVTVEDKVSPGRPSFLGMIDNMVSPKKEGKKETINNKTPSEKKQVKLYFRDSQTSNTSNSNEDVNNRENSEPLKVTALVKTVSPKIYSSPTSTSMQKKSVNTKLGPAKTVGLKRKKSSSNDDSKQSQMSIFDMFAFQPKAKLKIQ